MLLEQQLATAMLERVGMRADITSSKIASQLAKVPEAEQAGWVSHLISLPQHSAEWQSFIEPFLIHETYFFRHENQVDFMASVVLPALISERVRAGRFEFRIWCAACSSGEEAYSAALLLREAIKQSAEASGHDWRLSVVGTDLSSEVLLKARKGEYALSAGLNSFRDVPAFARHHFPEIFDHAQKTWVADESLKRIVSFQQRNVVSDPAPSTDIDLVMCRNVLIYLDEPSIQKCISTIRDSLRPGGVLILGPADMLRNQTGWELLTNQKAMFWKKSDARR